MTAIQQSTGDFGFGAEDVHLLASMKYWALRAESLKSSSYSRVRKHFMNDGVKEREQQAYREKKQAWADQWYSLTSKLLDTGVVLPEAELKPKLKELNLTETKKAALCVELATFTAYHEFAEASKDGMHSRSTTKIARTIFVSVLKSWTKVHTPLRGSGRNSIAALKRLSRQTLALISPWFGLA
jgi:hypothetical protein